MKKPTISEIYKIVENHIKKHNRIPVVFIDYLQFLCPEKGYDKSDKGAIDHNVSVIKSMTSSLGCPVVVITSMNRASYESGPSLSAAAGSNSIEYTCDSEAFLTNTKQNSKDKAKEYNPASQKRPLLNREIINVTAVKNRSAQSNISCELEFYPAFGYFQTVGRTGNK